MAWIRIHWRWLLLNLLGLAVLIGLLYQATVFRGLGWWPRNAGYIISMGMDAQVLAMLEAGKWSVRFLLICLSMTPLYLVFGWRGAPGLRKSAGLWAFAFGMLHFIFYINEIDLLQYWPQLFQNLYLLTGVLTLAILTALALTSHRWAMRWLGKTWKRLHRLVYAAGILAVVHGLLAAQASKKMAILDPFASQELALYLALLSVLLLLRVPAARSLTGLSRGKRRIGKRSFAQADG